MDRVRIDIGELGAAGAFGARDEGQLPVAARKASATPAGRRWLSFGLRVVRNAAIAVALMTLVPSLNRDAERRSPLAGRELR